MEVADMIVYCIYCFFIENTVLKIYSVSSFFTFARIIRYETYLTGKCLERLQIVVKTLHVSFSLKNIFREACL